MSKNSRVGNNSVDLDQMLYFLASDLAQHCLLRPLYICSHITKTRLFKYTENLTTKKMKIFR